MTSHTVLCIYSISILKVFGYQTLLSDRALFSEFLAFVERFGQTMNSRDSNLEFLKSLLTGFDEQLASVCALDDFFTGEAVSHGRDLLKDEWALRQNEIFLAMSASNKTVCYNPRESENTTSSALELSENHQDGSPVNNAESEEDTIVAEDEEAVKIEFDASESYICK